MSDEFDPFSEGGAPATDASGSDAVAENDVSLENEVTGADLEEDSPEADALADSQADADSQPDAAPEPEPVREPEPVDNEPDATMYVFSRLAYTKVQKILFLFFFFFFFFFFCFGFCCWRCDLCVFLSSVGLSERDLCFKLIFELTDLIVY